MKTILIWASLFLMADAYGIDLNEYKNFSCRVSTSNGTEVLSGAYEYEWDADDNPANYRVGFDEKKLKDGRLARVSIQFSKDGLVFIGAQLGTQYNEMEIIANDIDAVNLMMFTGGAIFCKLK